MNPWQRVRHLFEDDDGSLPDIFFLGASPVEVTAMYEWLASLCASPPEAIAWNRLKQADVPIRDIHHPARAFFAGEIESFRHVLPGLSVRGIQLPLLSVGIEGGDLSMDYRMGPEWNERAVLAFFDLLMQLQALAPKAKVVHADEGNFDRPNTDFGAAFENYVEFAGPRAR